MPLGGITGGGAGRVGGGSPRRANRPDNGGAAATPLAGPPRLSFRERSSLSPPQKRQRDDGGPKATPLAGPPRKRQTQVSTQYCYRLNDLICSAASYKELTTIIWHNHSNFNEVNTATACSQLAKRKKTYDDHVNPKMMVDLEVAIKRNISKFKPRELANTAWAFAKLNCPLPDALKEELQAPKAGYGAFSPQNLANTAWACAKLNYPLPNALKRELQERNAEYHTFKPQDLAITAWAICINGDDEFLKSLIFNCFSTLAVNGSLFSRKEQTMLRFVDMYLKYVLKVEDEYSFHSSILTNIRLINYQLPHPQITTIQTNANNVIQHLEYRTDIEHIIAGIFQVDILVTHQTDPSKQCIIELDGNQHYLSTGELCPKDQRRDRILSELGYEIIRIKNNDWLAKSPADQLSFIRSKLDQSFNH